MNYQTLLTVAQDAAINAGKFIMKNQDTQKKVNEEFDYTIKLQMDIDTESKIIERIQSTFPNHNIISEEIGQLKTDSEFCWIIDPIDGTANYFRNIPHYCVSIACMRNKENICGVILDPSRQECFTVVKNGEFCLNNNPQQVSTNANPKRATMVIGYNKKEKYLALAKQSYATLLDKIPKIRCSGSSALDLAWVAMGRLDAALELGVYLWDVAAGIQMIKQAGGKVFIGDYNKQTLQLNVIATNANIPISLYDGIIDSAII